LLSAGLVHLDAAIDDVCPFDRMCLVASAGASVQAATAYAQSSDSSSSYAIGTLDNLAAAGVPTESGMPSDHTPACYTGSGASASAIALYAVLGLVGVALLIAALVRVTTRRDEPMMRRGAARRGAARTPDATHCPRERRAVARPVWQVLLPRCFHGSAATTTAPTDAQKSMPEQEVSAVSKGQDV
jgi:hypothetical protein